MEAVYSAQLRANQTNSIRALAVRPIQWKSLRINHAHGIHPISMFSIWWRRTNWKRLSIFDEWRHQLSSAGEYSHFHRTRKPATYRCWGICRLFWGCSRNIAVPIRNQFWVGHSMAKCNSFENGYLRVQFPDIVHHSPASGIRASDLAILNRFELATFPPVHSDMGNRLIH